jgi:hypothetical protein
MKSEGYNRDILYKVHIGKLGVINAVPALNTYLHRLESLCHQPKMNFTSASMVRNFWQTLKEFLKVSGAKNYWSCALDFIV